MLGGLSDNYSSCTVRMYNIIYKKYLQEVKNWHLVLQICKDHLCFSLLILLEHS